MQTVKYVYWEEGEAWLGYLRTSQATGPRAKRWMT
jgi:hypothetical protein